MNYSYNLTTGRETIEKYRVFIVFENILIKLVENHESSEKASTNIIDVQTRCRRDLW